MVTPKSANRNRQKAKSERKKETPTEFLSSVAMVLATGLFIITFNIQAFEIPTSSMENTLLIGDHVFVDRITAAPPTHWAFFEHYRSIQRGDIVVFFSVETPGMHVVKRVIGIPGDRIHLRDGSVYRNGQALKEPYVIHSLGDQVPYRDNFPAIPPQLAGDSVIPGWPLRDGEDVVVPPDRYFVMGDNRDVSHDSRYFGLIPREKIIGRPLFIYWSFETPPGQWQKTDIGDRLSFYGHVAVHIVDQTRWTRMFRLVH
ncbi:MAG TPA: signal peptidase I [Terriglobales bacterium]|nr:signal peptidase I [Terriglobales bacterium]